MRSKAVRHAGRCIGVVVLTGLPTVSHAQEVRTGMIVGTGVSVETNPYNAGTTNNTQFSLDAQFNPSITVQDELTQISIRGSAQFRQFFKTFGLEDNYSVDTQFVSHRSERVSLHGGGSFSYSNGGFGYGGPNLIAPSPINSSPLDPSSTTPNLTLDPSGGLTDVNLLGTRTRILAFGSSLGVDYMLTPRTSLTVDGNANALRYKSVAGSDYNSLGGELRFNHQFDELLSVGLIGSYSRTNYLDPNQGDAGVLSSMLSVDRKFGEHWSASVALGASFTNIDGTLGFPATHYNSLTGRLRFCRQGEFTRLCLAGERSPQPSVNGNVRVTTNLNADYTVSLSARESVTVTGAYARTGSGRTPLLVDPPVEFASGTARYDNNINKTFTAFVSGSVSKIYSSVAPRSTNFSGSLGIQIHLGNPQ